VRRPNHSGVALKSFEPLLSLFGTIPDPRRAEGKLYQLPHVLLFSVFAMVSGANSYRGIRTYLKVHRQRLNKAFAIKWKRPPAEAYPVVPGSSICSGCTGLMGWFGSAPSAGGAPSCRIPVAVLRRRGLRLIVWTPFRGLSRLTMSQ